MSSDKTLRTLKIIGTELKGFIEDIEKTFSLKVNSGILKQIFTDAESDLTSAKTYLLFEATKNLCKSDLVIIGWVEAYEPEAIWIEISGMSEKDLQYLH